MELENLDSFASAEKLREWAGQIVGVRPVTVAKQMFPVRAKGRVRAVCDLRNYAHNKATAMDCRMRGDIQTAAAYEAICDRIYDRLPVWARW